MDELVREQLQSDFPGRWAEAVKAEEAEAAEEGEGEGESNLMHRLMEEGRRKNAFYLCAACEGPYFGGTVGCGAAGDDEDNGPNEEDDDDELPPGQANRLCPSCRPQSQAACRDPLRHRAGLVWKCRYCCAPATYVCYGSVHLCGECHERNGRLVQEQRRRRWNGNAAGSAAGNNNAPLLLEAQPCPGGDACPHPKPAGTNRHSNGPTIQSEQVYRCAWCSHSNTNSSDGHPRHTLASAGSRNFIRNPSGRRGLAGWRQLNPRMGWVVEEDGNNAVVDHDGRLVGTCFVSSYDWCVMAQPVPLHCYVADPASVTIEAAAQYMGRTDCPSVFRLELLLLDAHGRELGRQRTELLRAPQDVWERSTLVIRPTAGLQSVVLIVYGKDDRFWRGRYGSKVADCSVRVLGDEEELERVLLPSRTATSTGGTGRDEREATSTSRAEVGDAEDTRPAATNGTAPNNEGQQRRLDLHVERRMRPGRREVARHEDRAGRALWVREHAFDLLLPFALVLFAWMANMMARSEETAQNGNL